MTDEYEPLGGTAAASDDLDVVREHFAAAAQPFVASPLSWLGWSVVLPAAALATPTATGRGGLPAGLLLWSIAILVGGGIEVLVIWRRDDRRADVGARGRATALARWVLRAQGNVSLVALVLSVALLAFGMAAMLPALWLLLIGHSLYTHGGLAFDSFRPLGLWFQAGGVVALLAGAPLVVLAVVTGTGNLWMAWRVWRARRRRSSSR